MAAVWPTKQLYIHRLYLLYISQNVILQQPCVYSNILGKPVLYNIGFGFAWLQVVEVSGHLLLTSQTMCNIHNRRALLVSLQCVKFSRWGQTESNLLSGWVRAEKACIANGLWLFCLFSDVSECMVCHRPFLTLSAAAAVTCIVHAVNPVVTDNDIV